MLLSKWGIDLLKAIETLALRSYDDTIPNGGTLAEWNQHATIDYGHLKDAWKAFNKQGGNVVSGLDNRRNAEWNIFVDGVYEQS